MRLGKVLFYSVFVGVGLASSANATVSYLSGTKSVEVSAFYGSEAFYVTGGAESDDDLFFHSSASGSFNDGIDIAVNGADTGRFLVGCGGLNCTDLHWSEVVYKDASASASASLSTSFSESEIFVHSFLDTHYQDTFWYGNPDMLLDGTIKAKSAFSVTFELDQAYEYGIAGINHVLLSEDFTGTGDVILSDALGAEIFSIPAAASGYDAGILDAGIYTLSASVETGGIHAGYLTYGGEYDVGLKLTAVSVSAPASIFALTAGLFVLGMFRRKSKHI